MKKSGFFIRLFFSVLTSCLLFLSCSGNNSDVAEDSGTLRHQTDVFNKNTSWSEEIEKNRLNEPLPAVNGIVSGVKLNSLSLNASVSGGRIEYPFVEGFGSVDISNIPSGALSSVKKFCGSVIDFSAADELMLNGCAYELVLLNNDLDELFPVKELEEGGKDKRFSSYLIGMEIQTNSTCEIPVRFIKDKMYLDMIVYFCLENNDWKIYGFDLLKWENKHGN